jgi:hypothetical protein
VSDKWRRTVISGEVSYVRLLVQMEKHVFLSPLLLCRFINIGVLRPRGRRKRRKVHERLSSEITSYHQRVNRINRESTESQQRVNRSTGVKYDSRATELLQ